MVTYFPERITEKIFRGFIEILIEFIFLPKNMQICLTCYQNPLLTSVQYTLNMRKFAPRMVILSDLSFYTIPYFFRVISLTKNSNLNSIF